MSEYHKYVIRVLTALVPEMPLETLENVMTIMVSKAGEQNALTPEEKELHRMGMA